MGQKKVKKVTEAEMQAESDVISQKLQTAQSKVVKKKKVIKKGKAYIKATYNNTIVTLTDINGAVLGWSSAGVLGFKGAKKATPYAASLIVKAVVEKVKKIGLEEVEVFVNGVGGGRSAAVRALAANGLSISAIEDATPIPHNGCRPPKPRRV